VAADGWHASSGRRLWRYKGAYRQRRSISSSRNRLAYISAWRQAAWQLSGQRSGGVEWYILAISAKFVAIKILLMASGMKAERKRANERQILAHQHNMSMA